MDREDGYMAMIEAQKRAFLAGKDRKGQKATNKASRREIEQTYSSYILRCPPMHQQTRTSFVSFAYPPSTRAIQDLEPIRLSDLRLETHHTGRVLIVRAFTQAKRVLSVQVGIEDELGDVDHLALYNGDPKLTPTEVLAKDAVFAVKEPHYKAAASGGYIVRVDHPSDLIRLPNTHSQVPLALQPRLVELDNPATTCKLQGNDYYKAKNFLAALESYTQGLAECGEDEDQLRSDLLRNRSIVNLHLQRHEPAAADALTSIHSSSNDAVTIKKNNGKALYRAGCALYHQGVFKKALDHFRQALDKLLNDADCLREIDRTECRLKEQSGVDYDLVAISKSASKKHNRLDRASFLKNVEVREIDKKGRGLCAAQDLKAGDLVLCEKAFTVAFASDSEAETYVLLNVNTNSGATGTQATLMFTLTQKMLHNSSAAASFFDLYDGGYTPKCTAPQVDGVTVVDTFQVAATTQFNAFGCPNVRTTDTPDASEMDSDPRSATGIWINASYINHACDGNAMRSFIGDLMIVRATKDIAKGTEITMPYRAGGLDHVENRKTLQKYWKFKCACDVCIVEMKTGETQSSRRRQLATETETLLKNNRHTAFSHPSKEIIATAQKLYTQLEATYDNALFAGKPRLALIDLGLWLLSAQPQNPSSKAVIDRAVEILRNCGYGVEVKGRELKIDYTHCFVHNAAVDAAMHASHACFFKGDRVLGGQFEKFGKKLYVMRCGVEVGFDERYGSHH